MTIDYGMGINEESRSANAFLPPDIELPGPFSTKGVWQGVSPGFIEFHPLLAIKISNIVEQAFLSPDPLLFCVPGDIVKSLGNEVKRLICAIDGYISSPNPLIPLSSLILGIRDYEFAKKLKKLRTAVLTRSFELESVSDDDLDQVLSDFSYIDPKRLRDIGDIFNYRYWFRWEEDCSDDWKHSMIPVRVAPGMVEKFEEALLRILPETLAPVVKDEILLSLSPSTCISGTSPGKKSKVYREKSDPRQNTFSRDPLKGYFSKVQKGPTEVRECITLTIAQSNSVKWIEKQCAVLARKLSTSNYGKDEKTFNDDLKDFWSSNKFFLNRDLTKEGWTKPRWMLKSIQKVCMKKYPNCDAFGYMSIYDKFDLVKDGVTYATNRGHGLGMANALTTIMQCAVFELICYERGDMIREPSALFYNDDGTIGSQDEDDIIAYTEHEDPILEDLGLLRKDKKTYKGKVSILCECYSDPGLDTKASYSEYIRRIPFSAPCLMVAKTQAYMCTDPIFGAVDTTLISRLVNFFGYEYDPSEYLLPHWAGGWQILNYKGVDLTFLEEPKVDPQLLARGFSVGQPRLKPPVFNRGAKRRAEYVHPSTYMYPMDGMDPRVHEPFMIHQPIEKIDATFSRGLSRHSQESWLISESILRKKRWNTPAKQESIAFYYKRFIDANPWIDVIPPESCMEERNIFDWTVHSPDTKYPAGPKQPNPILGSVSYFCNKYIKHCIPIPYIPGRVHERTFITEDRLDKFQESVLAIPGFSRIICDKPREMTYSVLKKRRYNSDYDVIDAYATATGKMGIYPEPVYLSVGGQISKENEKYSYFAEIAGRDIYWEWWVTWGRTIPYLIMSRQLSLEEFAEILDVDLEETPEIPATQVVEDWDDTIDFWMWKSDPSLNPHPGRKVIFIDVHQLLMKSDMLYVAPEYFTREDERLRIQEETGVVTKRSSYLSKVLELAGEGVPEEGSPLDNIYKNVTKVLGCTLYGVYHYRPPRNDLFASGGSESGSEEEGLFDSLW